MKINEAGLKLVKDQEGYFPTSYPDIASPLGRACAAKKISVYNDKYKQLPGWEKIDGGPWTIGWGSTGPDIKPDMKWTVEQCEARLRQEMARFEIGIAQKIKVPLTSNQFSALCSFCYNLGLGPLDQSVGKKLNAGDYAGAADAMLAYNKAGRPLQVLPGLTKRREAEKKLFLTPDSASSQPVATPSPAPAKNSSLLPEGPSEADIRKMLGEVEDKILKK